MQLQPDQLEEASTRKLAITTPIYPEMQLSLLDNFEKRRNDDAHDGKIRTRSLDPEAASMYNMRRIAFSYSPIENCFEQDRWPL